MKILLVAEGSGGHLIPALQVAQSLSRQGASIKLWYAQRRQTAPLAGLLAQEASDARVDVDPIPLESSAGWVARLWRCGQLWQRAQRCFDTFHPDVVVGFGGWVSAPVVLAACLRRDGVWPWRGRQARQRRIGCLLHEQNVELGRTNRWLAPWVDRVALSFRETQQTLRGREAVVTGLPIREHIGHSSRAEAAERFGFDAGRPTLLVLGGSQGARALNRLMARLAPLCTTEERIRWQVIHLVGHAEEAGIRQAYERYQITSWVTPFLVEMEAAYALADLVLARAGASTIAELARCGTPAILIPYPHAHGHQRANARLVEALGGGVVIEEAEASPERVLAAMRRILSDRRLQEMMGSQIRLLWAEHATDRLSDAIVEVARHPGPTTARAARPGNRYGRAGGAGGEAGP